MIFIPPVVEPADPPTKRRKKTSTFDIAGQFSKSSVAKPVVVINDIDVKKEWRIVSRLKEYASVFTILMKNRAAQTIISEK